MIDKRKKENFFYFLRDEDLIPEDQMLRPIGRHVDFSFTRQKLEHLYSHAGLPSVDPNVMMRMLFGGHLFGIISERRLCFEVDSTKGTLPSFFASERLLQFPLRAEVRVDTDHQVLQAILINLV